MHPVSEAMHHVHTLAKRDPRTRLHHRGARLADPPWLRQAWEARRAKQGRMTAGIDATIAPDITPERLPQGSERWQAPRDRPQPGRRVDIANGHGTRRPFGMPTREARLVPHALRREPILEADFSPCSHGFRRDRSTPTARREVARRAPRPTWTSAGDSVGGVDNIPHGPRMKAVEPRLADATVRRRRRRVLTAGDLEPWPDHTTYRGTPHGGGRSPLRCHIFLPQLAAYVLHDLQANNPPSPRVAHARRQPAYRPLETTSTRLRRRLTPPQGPARHGFMPHLTDRERPHRTTPDDEQAHTHPTTGGDARDADAVVRMGQGPRPEAHAVTDHIGTQRHARGRARSEAKPTRTPGRHRLTGLGSHIHGTRGRTGTSIRPLRSLPHEQRRPITDA